MTVSTTETLSGQLVDEHTAFTVEEVLTACSISTDVLVSLVDEGIIEPIGEDLATWRFTGTAILRGVKAMRLKRDLEIELSAVALVLDLLQEVENLQRRLVAVSGLPIR